MTASERVAYLKGLAEGLGIEADSKEGKIIKAIIDVLEDLAYGLEDAEANLAEFNEGLDAVSEDLEDVEEYVFGEDDDYCDCDDDDCDCCDEDDYDYSVVCPSCNEELLLEDKDIEAGVLQCPCCGETLELDFDDCDCEDCDCEEEPED